MTDNDRQICAECGERIVHPDRKYRVCLDCYIGYVEEHGHEMPS